MTRLSPAYWPVRWRIAAVSAGLTLLILLSFALIVGRLATDKIRDDHRNQLQSVANEIAVQAQLGSPLDYLKRTVVPRDGVVRVVDANGNPYAVSADEPTLGPLRLHEVVTFGPYEVAAQRVTTNELGSGIYVQYGETHASVDATVNRLWLLLGMGVAGGTILAFLAGLAVAQRAMSPIASMTAVAREIAMTRDPSKRLPKPESDDEVAELARTLDQMLSELDAARSETEQMIQAQRDFVADASHELRTPLTSVLANLELLEARLAEAGGDPEDIEIVGGALGSARRMRRLVSDLLLLARADAGRGGLRRESDLADIAEGAISEVRAVSDDHPIELEAEPVKVECNPDDVHRLVLNLTENAVRHTPPGTPVTVSIRAEGDDAVVEVTDEGPGIPEGLGDQIFSRFVRGSGPADLSRGSGTGLGLAIVKAVATAHGGTVEAANVPGRGARFTFRMPRLTIDEQTLTNEPAGVQ